MAATWAACRGRNLVGAASDACVQPGAAMCRHKIQGSCLMPVVLLTCACSKPDAPRWIEARKTWFAMG